ncbi:hypothetical protein NQ317_014735 [Molorchus minor]|uniref:WD repeat and HMG-box DNA-binding protein 1 n=1 Tax=Molorchus minor TaxID=1323400 RepID=A0ABQ9J210_9CUCU|nr:hypothetical protein NQ317_014735 [Molorchus minor]
MISPSCAFDIIVLEKMSVIQEPLRYAHDEGHTDVCFTEDGDKYITCGADGDIRIWLTDESEDPVHNCVGEWALCVKQKGDKLYVSTSSNDIQILTLPDGERDGVLDRFVAPINHIAIGKNSELIALAGEDMEIKIRNLERNDKQVKVLGSLSGPCLSIAICPNSKMIAASSGDSKLRIWDVENMNLLKEISCFPKVNSFSNVKVLCRIDFEPTQGKHLAYPNQNVVIILTTDDWSQTATLVCDQVSASYSIVQYSPCGKYILATSDEGDFVVWDVSSQTVTNTSKHPKSTAITGVMWNPKGNGTVVYTDVEGQLGILSKLINDNSENQRILNLQKNDSLVDNEDFENLEFGGDERIDHDDITLEKSDRDFMGRSSRCTTPRARTPEVLPQRHFMPSSTPEHLDPRYLCWNEVGVIKSYGNTSDETSSKSIEVEFHDTTFHNSMMLQNYQDYTMGTISKAALVSNICDSFVRTSKEWILKAGEYEEIILIAASENLVCFVMNNYIIRVLWSQWWHLKNILMVAYHSAGVRKGDQCISIRLIKLEGYVMEIKDISSALGPESSLMWLGFSDVGTPAMMDSLGMLSLYPHSCNTWIPFCDTTRHRQSPSDGFFVTTVFESYQAVGGIKCKGSMYPGFAPRPTMCELPLEPPFAEVETEKTQMEMNLFMWSTLQIMDTDKKFKETAVKTFALACRNNLDERALEFQEILSNPQILTLSLKYASRMDKKKIGVTELSTPDPTVVKPAYKKLSLSSSKYSRNKLHKTQEKSTPEVLRDTQTSEVLTSFDASENSQNMTENSGNTSQSLINTQAGEKRKHSDPDGEKPKGKQRKLGSFGFAKHT